MQFDPHLHPFPPSAAFSPDSTKLFMGATPSMMVIKVVDFSKSGYIPHPPPLPHLQPDPQPQFPPQQDMFNFLNLLLGDLLKKKV